MCIYVFMFYMFYGLLLFVTRVNSITYNTFPGTITVWVTFVFAKYSTGYVGKVGVATCNAFPLKWRHFGLRRRGFYLWCIGRIGWLGWIRHGENNGWHAELIVGSIMNTPVLLSF